MRNYIQITGRQPDFRVAYQQLPARQRLFQHMRSNVHWKCDIDPNRQWSIWLEFESSDCQVLAENVEPLDVGTATMWILFDQPDYRKELAQWLRVGQEGFFMAGFEKIASFSIIEIMHCKSEA